MSSHREAPEISKDPAADNTDVYAFVSPDQPDTVTPMANYLPFQNPQGGPNFYEFGDDVLYEIHVSNAGDAKADVTYQFRFQTKIRNPKTFLYNTGPIASIDDAAWNRPQTYSVTRVAKGKSVLVGRGLTVPPVNVGTRSTPNYQNLAAQAIHRLPGGRRVFAGQRAEGFFVDLGSVFDLAGLRPFNDKHLIPLPVMEGVNGTQGLNVHSIALQVPISDLTRDGKRPQDVADPAAAIGVWATPSRRAVTIRGDHAGNPVDVGPYVQVSRLGNPLFNEVIVPMSRKDEWNATDPNQDKDFAQYVAQPELAGLLPVLYPGVFPNLAAYTKPRADLSAILLTGIPAGIIPGFQNFTGPPKPTCCASTSRSHLPAPPTRWGWSLLTPLASPTGAGSSTTSSRLSSGGSGPDHPARRPELHPRRGHLGNQGRHDQHERALPRHLPLPGPPRRWVPVHAMHPGSMSRRTTAPSDLSRGRTPASLAEDRYAGARPSDPRHRRRHGRAGGGDRR